MRHRKISIARRLANVWSYIRHPLLLVELCLISGAFGIVLNMLNPCGKGSSAVNGVCSNGELPSTPLSYFAFGCFVTLLLVLVLASTEKNEQEKSLALEIIRTINKTIRGWPKWRKKWFAPAFASTYILLAIALSLIDSKSGLSTKYIVGRYAIVVPFFALGTTPRILNIGRQLYRRLKEL